ncbi:hypothetical protein BH11ACT8_BH11ACT8_21060 [soil metagenome]
MSEASGKHLGEPPTQPIAVGDEQVDRAGSSGSDVADVPAPGNAPRSLTAVPSADLVASTPPPGAPEEKRDVVACPACHTSREVAVNRRHSTDFCPEPGCDYPLFWTPSVIAIGPGDAEADSLRRRPGTDGRVTVASRPCPHCDEANLLDALVCLRCGLSMTLMAPPPVPEPVYVPAPAPVEPEPERRTPFWVWVVLFLTTLLAIGLIVWAVQS